MSNSGGPRRRRVPERTVSGRAARCIAWCGGTPSVPEMLRRRRSRFADLWFDGRAAAARPGHSTEASLHRRPAVSMGLLELESRTPSIAARGSSGWSRARLQRETLSDWRRIFSGIDHRTATRIHRAAVFGSSAPSSCPAPRPRLPLHRLRQSSSRFMEEGCARHPTMRMAMAPTPFASFMAVARTPQARCLPDSGAT